MIKEKNENFGFCFRCEHRIHFLEVKSRNKKHCSAPRLECTMENFSSNSCYMYCPVRPVIMKQENKNDVRPFPGSPMFSARGKAIRALDPFKDNIKLSLKRLADGMFLYWIPEEVLKSFIIQKIKINKSKNKK